MKKTRIAVVGDYKIHPMEGMEVITKKIADDLTESGNFSVSKYTLRKLLIKMHQIMFRRYDVYVFTHGPGKGVLVASFLIKLFSKSKIIWVASRPDLAGVPKYVIKNIKVDEIIGVFKNNELIEIAHNNNIETKSTIIGVDRSKLLFTDRSKNEVLRTFFKESYNCNKPLILHVGHLRVNRGLEQLIRIKKNVGSDVNILVVASTSLSSDDQLEASLTDAGIAVYKGYIDNLGDIYRVSDLYVFPANPDILGAIDLPLSVVEALACGVTVLATRFGVLADFLDEKDGVFYSEFNDVPEAAIALVNKSMVLPKVKLNKKFYLCYLSQLISQKIKN